MESKQRAAEIKRAMVTIGAIALFAVGSHIPLPGVAATTFGEGTPPGVSIFALGVRPIVFSLTAMEIARLAVPALARWAAKGPREAQL